jgi:hypothetical protein
LLNARWWRCKAKASPAFAALSAPEFTGEVHGSAAAIWEFEPSEEA